jgi:hypothetical protein
MKYEEVRMIIQAYAQRIIERKDMSYMDMVSTLKRLEDLKSRLTEAWNDERGT